jgi:hypothetical protein
MLVRSRERVEPGLSLRDAACRLAPRGQSALLCRGRLVHLAFHPLRFVPKLIELDRRSGTGRRRSPTPRQGEEKENERAGVAER